MAVVSTEEGAARLGELITGLLFVSESDAPLRVIQLAASRDLDASTLLRALSKPVTTPVSEQPLSALFDRTVQDQPWHSPAERATVERYRALVDFLSHSLVNARVFRLGHIEVEAYALGETSDGEWLGVATTLIET